MRIGAFRCFHRGFQVPSLPVSSREVNYCLASRAKRQIRETVFTRTIIRAVLCFEMSHWPPPQLSSPLMSHLVAEEKWPRKIARCGIGAALFISKKGRLSLTNSRSQLKRCTQHFACQHSALITDFFHGASVRLSNCAPSLSLLRPSPLICEWHGLHGRVWSLHRTAWSPLCVLRQRPPTLSRHPVREPAIRVPVGARYEILQVGLSSSTSEK